MAELGALLLNASEYFKNQEFSDVTIALLEDPAPSSPAEEAAAKRRKLADGSAATADGQTQHMLRLPGHKLLLCTCSSVCKTQISRWTESSPHELEMRVPVGQLHIGELMIKCMYEPNPDLSSYSQQQLLQLLMLSDQHDVPKAVYAASRALSQINSEDFEWDTVQAVFSLPPACPDMQAYKPLFAAVATRLQEHLGDLDKTLQSSQLLQQLTGLPHLGILQLLKDDRTRVHRENTVVLVIHLWIRAQKRAARARRLQQQQLQEGECTEAAPAAAFGGTTEQQQLPAAGQAQQGPAAGAASSATQHQQPEQPPPLQQQDQTAASLADESQAAGAAATVSVDGGERGQQQEQAAGQHAPPSPMAAAMGQPAGSSAAAATAAAARSAGAATAAEPAVGEEHDHPPQKQIEQLAHLIRVQHCSQLYVGTTMFGYPLIAKCFTGLERHLACIYSEKCNGNNSQLGVLQGFSTAVYRFPAWSAPKRPASAVDSLELAITLNLEWVQELAEMCLAAKKTVQLKLKGGYFKGRHLILLMRAEYQSKAVPPGGCKLVLGAAIGGAPKGSLAVGALEFQVLAAPPNQPGVEPVHDLIINASVGLQTKVTYLDEECLQFGVVTDWLATERNVRAKGFVHSDGCMHIIATFHDPSY